MESSKKVLELHIYIYSVCLFIGCLIVALYLFKSNSGFAKGLILPSLVILMSGLSMMMMYRLDSLVHGDLYGFGLQFNETWANEYWLLQRSIMGFNSIVIAVALGMVVKERIYPSKLVHKPQMQKTPSTPKKEKTEKKRRIRAPKIRKDSTDEAPQKSMQELMEEEGEEDGNQ